LGKIVVVVSFNRHGMMLTRGEGSGVMGGRCPSSGWNIRRFPRPSTGKLQQKEMDWTYLSIDQFPHVFVLTNSLNKISNQQDFTKRKKGKEAIALHLNVLSFPN